MHRHRSFSSASFTSVGEDAAPPIVMSCRLLKSCFWRSGEWMQSVDHRWNHGASSHALLLDQTEHFRWTEMVNHDMGAANHRDGVSRTPAVGVKQRNGMQQHRSA